MKVFFLLLVLMNECFSAEVLKIEYDEVWVSRLKLPLKEHGKKAILDKDGILKKAAIESSVKLDKALSQRVVRILSENDLDNGKGDIRLQLFALVFLRENKVVLTVTPNILGGDLYATDNDEVFDPRSLSGKQTKELVNVFYLAFATKEVQQGLPLLEMKNE